MKTLVMGAGAVGCYYGAMLARAGHPVTLVGRQRHVEVIRRDGLILEQGTALEALKPELERLGHRVRVDSLGLKANAAELTAAGWRGAAGPWCGARL